MIRHATIAPWQYLASAFLAGVLVGCDGNSTPPPPPADTAAAEAEAKSIMAKEYGAGYEAYEKKVSGTKKN